jgi:HD-like signal output (HDOD) protein
MTKAALRVRNHRPLPARADAACRTLALCGDPNSSVADLSKAIGSDPAMTSRVIALANSAYYGLSGRVGTLQYAISVLGFQTIRALAVPIAAGLDGANAVPAGFWEQAATAATAATIIAPIVGANAPDAFCAGLLHTLGAALLHQQHPLPQLCLPYPDDDSELERIELETYQIGHAAAADELLRTWRFPDALCTLIATHHDVPLADASPLTRTLHAARTLADQALARQPDTVAAQATLERISEGILTRVQLGPLIDQIRSEAEALLAGLRAQ